MNTEHDWLVWWHDEGSGMRPVNGQDHESHVRDMTRIAWLNGAFGAADEIERLRKKLLGEENAYDILRLENERIRAELVTISNRLNLERDEWVGIAMAQTTDSKRRTPMIEPTQAVKVEPPTTPTITIVAIALENVLSDLWHEQNKHKYIGDHPEEFRKFCESVLYSAFSKENQQ